MINLDVDALEHAFQSKISRGRDKGFPRRSGRGRGCSQTKEKSQMSRQTKQPQQEVLVVERQIQYSLSL